MSVNKHRPHLYLLPEDDANRQLANGFWKAVAIIRQMYVLPVAGGWREVLNLFESVHIAEMDRWQHRLMILLIDLDDHPDRLTDAKNGIPERLRDRVFVLGVSSQPEALKARLGIPFEAIGSEMVHDCREGTDETWGHDLLKHNASELERLRNGVCPILFPAPPRGSHRRWR
jgi:hypothetical protein